MMIIICIWLEKIYAYCGCESAHKMVFYVQLDKRFASVAAASARACACSSHRKTTRDYEKAKKLAL